MSVWRAAPIKQDRRNSSTDESSSVIAPAGISLDQNNFQPDLDWSAQPDCKFEIRNSKFRVQIHFQARQNFVVGILN
jgi:hypothetical protein